MPKASKSIPVQIAISISNVVIYDSGYLVAIAHRTGRQIAAAARAWAMKPISESRGINRGPLPSAEQHRCPMGTYQPAPIVLIDTIVLLFHLENPVVSMATKQRNRESVPATSRQSE
jgi:hypothetical protein